MKRTALTILICLLAGLVSCQKEKFSAGDIDIEFQFATLPVDLNLPDNPYITCVVNSDTPLEKVSMFVLYADGSREQYKSDIVSFFNPVSCSIFERPVYRENMSGFQVVAFDKGGAREEKVMNFNIVAAVKSPQISFGSETIAFAEGDPIPSFSFSVNASADLESVKVELVESGVASDLVMPVDGFADPRLFAFKSDDYTLADYDVNKTPSAIRVTATDSYGKVSIALLYIDYHSLPAPVVSVDAIPVTAEFSPVTVSGKATSESGLSSVSFYTVGDNYSCLVGSRDLGGSLSADFTFPVDGNEIRDYITGIKTVVKDSRNKITEVTTSIGVAPGMYQVGADDDLLSVLKAQDSDPKFRSIKLKLAPGAVYSLGTSTYTFTKTTIIEGCEGESMPQIQTNASDPFRTDGTVADSLCFRNVHFNSKKSGGFMNNSGGCTIGSIVFDGCVIDGAFSNYFYRAAGSNNIGSLRVSDCVIWWNNVSGTYAFFHFTQNSDRIAEVRLTDSTVGGVFYLLYNNIKESTFNGEVSRCTFVNQKGTASGYWVSFANSSLTGTFSISSNLFGGTNNITGMYRMLRANKMSCPCTSNWCTPSWKTFTDDSTNGSVNFLTILPAGEDNGNIFADPSAKDFSLKAGTTPYKEKAGDPRWIK